MTEASLTHEQRLERTLRETDYPFTYFVINPLNRLLLRPLHALHVSPTTVTILSFAMALVAAWFLGRSVRDPGWAGVGGVVFAFLSHLLDALDGDLARYRQRFSAFGAALDPILDRVGECAWIAAVVLATGPTPASAQAGMACLGGILTYYYVVDGPVRFALAARVHETRRFAVTSGTATRTRLKYGLFEPYTYGFPLLVAFGFANGALWGFAAAFWMATLWQVVRLPARVRPTTDR